MLSTPVLVVGGGPVGLTLALDLAARGVRCTLVERKDAPAFLPKMERCNARTMEIFRRMGIAERVRAAGRPTSLPMDVYHVITLMDPPLAHVRYGSPDALRAEARARNDGALPLEPYQLISQYTLEPLLKTLCDAHPNVDVRFGHELTSLAQDDDGVTARVRTTAGAALEVRAQYLVGCDGGTSTVRKRLGIALEGRGRIRQLVQALYYAPTLYDAVPIGPARHYKVCDEYRSGIVVQDSCKHFSMSSEHCTEDDMPRIFAAAVGAPVPFEMLSAQRWHHNLLCAQRYRDRRVVIAGDAAHLVVPTAGLGLNTGIGDAIDISWKVAALVHGWGGRELLQSYEDERRQIGVRNVRASSAATEERRSRRAAHWQPWIREDSPRGRALRAEIGRLAELEAHRTTVISGIERGYRYTNSALVWPEPGDGPDPDNPEYVPTTWPGARLPHVWLANGEALLDRIGPWFTVLRFGNRVDTRGLEDALAAAGAPFEVLALDAAEPAYEVYEGYDALLIRPDVHVAWRGRSAPRDPQAIVAAATGATDARTHRLEDALT